jgi:hypothetical protein
MAAQDWQALTRITAGLRFEIERVRLTDQDVAIEGRFELPPLAMLPADDQVFVAAFIRCHGSIKRMEQFFGVSYPTIKNRLNRIGGQLPFAELEPRPSPRPSTSDLIAHLERGEMSVNDVLQQLRSTEEGEGER